MIPHIQVDIETGLKSDARGQERAQRMYQELLVLCDLHSPNQALRATLWRVAMQAIAILPNAAFMQSAMPLVMIRPVLGEGGPGVPMHMLVDLLRLPDFAVFGRFELHADPLQAKFVDERRVVTPLERMSPDALQVILNPIERMLDDPHGSKSMRFKIMEVLEAYEQALGRCDAYRIKHHSVSDTDLLSLWSIALRSDGSTYTLPINGVRTQVVGTAPHLVLNQNGTVERLELDLYALCDLTRQARLILALDSKASRLILADNRPYSLHELPGDWQGQVIEMTRAANACFARVYFTDLERMQGRRVLFLNCEALMGKGRVYAASDDEGNAKTDWKAAAAAISMMRRP